MVFSLYFSSVPINPFSKFRLLWDQSGSIVIIFVGNKALVHFHPLFLVLHTDYIVVANQLKTNGVEKFYFCVHIIVFFAVPDGYSLRMNPFSELGIFVVIQWNPSTSIVSVLIGNKTLVHFHPLFLVLF